MAAASIAKGSAPTSHASTETSAQAALAHSNAQPSLSLTIEFTGGLEILFNNVSRHRLTLPATVTAPTATKTKAATQATPSSSSTTPTTVGYLIKWLLDNLLQDPRKELFVVDGTV